MSAAPLANSGGLATGVAWVRAPEHRLTIAAAFSAGAAFIAGKAVALLTGVDGTAYYGSLLSATTVLGGVALFGNLLALPQIRPEVPEGDWREMCRLLVKGMTPTLLICIAIAPAVFITLLGQDAGYTVLSLGLGSVVAVLGAVWGPAERVVLALVGTTNQILAQTVIAGALYLASLCFALVLLPPAWFPLWFGMSLLLGQVVASLSIHRLSSVYARGRSGHSISKEEHFRLSREMRAFSARLFATVSLASIAYAALPALVLLTAGAYPAGLFRSAFSIGTLALGALTGTIQLHIAPRVAQRNRTLTPDTQSSLLASASTTLRLSLLSTLLVSLFSPILLLLFFSDDFLGASAALCVLSLGGLFRILTAVNSTAFMAQGRYRGLAIVEVGGSLATLLLVGLCGHFLPSATALALAFTAGILFGYLVSEVSCRSTLSTSSTQVILDCRTDRWMSVACVGAVACCSIVYGASFG